MSLAEALDREVNPEEYDRKRKELQDKIVKSYQEACERERGYQQRAMKIAQKQQQLAPQQLMDASKYKKTTKKQYVLYACRPKIGTVIINKLEQRDLLNKLYQLENAVGEHSFEKALNASSITFSWTTLGGQFLPPKFLESKSRKLGYDLGAKLVQAGATMIQSNNDWVLCGTKGELWVIKGDRLKADYTFDAEPKAIKQADQTGKAMIVGYDWMRVESKSGTRDVWVLFIPKQYRVTVKSHSGAVLTANDYTADFDHLNGDFVVVPDAGGRPQLDGYFDVVNGRVFLRTYNNRGFDKELVESEEAQILHKQVDFGTKVHEGQVKLPDIRKGQVSNKITV